MTPARHVCVRREGTRPSITAPYDGLFKVLSRTEKTFTMELHGREEVTQTQTRLPGNLASVTCFRPFCRC
ncbi:hypothetical protein HPB50_003715 [Hyalomma asiaticum]|uniref:Uncharacterized protein n=1 Tax=Hyalomma asiaticum TaxID=266040 RepID=A0ACB7SS03_HYAAI|nr:hypothetical protein HPB50_003715 [Hyalomma asiaticum]